MKKKLCLLCLCFCVGFSACGTAASENETVSRETEQSISQEEEPAELTESTELAAPTELVEQNEPQEEPTETVAEADMGDDAVELPEPLSEEQKAVLLEAYRECFTTVNAKRMALIYLDGDAIPELIILKDGEYRLYSFDGSGVKPIVMPGAGIKANAYGAQHNFEGGPTYQTFYWFEYVPYEGLIRVHSGTDEERDDYYLRYTDGSFRIELEVKSKRGWHTYDAKKEIENEEFLEQLSVLGYDKLVPCEYLYGDVTAAYENINATSDSRQVLEDFVNGKIDAMEYTEGMSDIPEESFVTRTYQEYFDDITSREEWWGKITYLDIDNDHEDELLLRGYVNAAMFFDVVGDTVYKVLETSSTTDVASVRGFRGKRVIARTDLGHSGRKCYEIMQFDSCCCLVDWFGLNAYYEESEYTEEDEFEYRDREITMEEFEELVDSIKSVKQAIYEEVVVTW